jgi:phosphopantothenate---cysteine ligase (CTP)
VNCVVTAGPTYEPLDSVRRLTNFSTGKLGSDLADFLTEHDHQVVLLKSSSSTYLAATKAAEVLPFSTGADLEARLRSLCSQPIDAVFHAAAVGDFRFGKIWRRDEAGELQEVRGSKISSQGEPLLAELIPAPKTIAHLRTWFPQAIIAGWKYETDGGVTSSIVKAHQQIQENHTDCCVINGPAYGPGFGVLDRTGQCVHLQTDLALFAHFESLLVAKGPLSASD